MPAECQQNSIPFIYTIYFTEIPLVLSHKWDGMCPDAPSWVHVRYRTIKVNQNKVQRWLEGRSEQTEGRFLPSGSEETRNNRTTTRKNFDIRHDLRSYECVCLLLLRTNWYSCHTGGLMIIKIIEWYVIWMLNWCNAILRHARMP